MWRAVCLLVVVLGCKGQDTQHDGAQIAALQAQIADLQNDLRARTDALNALQSECSVCQQAVQDSRPLQAEAADLKTQLAVLADKVPDLEQSLQACHAASAACSEQALRDRQDSSASLERCQRLQDDHAAALRELDAAKGQCTGGAAAIDVAAERDLLQASLNECRSAQESCDAKLRNEGEERGASLKECQARVDESAARLHDLQATLGAQERECADKERSLKAVLTMATAKLNQLENDWLPLWAHVHYVRAVEAVKPAVAYYEKEIKSGKALAAAKVVAGRCYEQVLDAYNLIAQRVAALVADGARELRKSDAGRRTVQVLEEALVHTGAAFTKLRARQTELLSHPQVRSALDVGKRELKRTEQELSRLAAHVLSSSESTAPFADESTTRIIALALMYGMPGLVLVYCCVRRCAGRWSRARSSPLSTTKSAAAGRKAHGKGKPRGGAPKI